MAHAPDTQEAVWSRLKAVMAPGVLDPMVKGMLHVAVSTDNGCDHCIHSFMASAKAERMTAKIREHSIA